MIVTILCMTLLMLLIVRAVPDAGVAAPATPKPEAEAPALAPDFANVPYGRHPRQVLDFWKAKSDRPTPLLVFIHGGGFKGGDKSAASSREWMKSSDPAKRLLDSGISLASIHYRLTPEVTYPAPMEDGARAVQFLRSKAREWNLDATRFAAAGGSAGAGISMWIGFRDDRADPKSADPVARESTRLTCLVVYQGQCNYDPRFVKIHLPGDAYKNPCLPPLFGISPDQILDPPPEANWKMIDSAAITHLRSNAPPLYTSYRMSLSDTTGDIHHPNHGKLLKERYDALGLECTLVTKDTPPPYESELEFLRRQFGLNSPA